MYRDELTKSLPTALVAVSAIATNISVINNVSLVVTYSLFKKLRTLPGQVIISQAVTLIAESTVTLKFVVLLQNDYIYMYFVSSKWV